MRKKIGILLENRFIDQEIIYYIERFKEAEFEPVFLTRLWGMSELTFKGMELGMEVKVNQSFEQMNEEELNAYGAIIVPAGYVADYLLYSEIPKEKSPAVEFIERIMAKKEIVKGFICHALWIAAPIREAFNRRKVTCHNNIISHVENAGMIYVDQAICVDEDLITARTGGDFAKFALEIINSIPIIKERCDKVYEKSIVYRNSIPKIQTGKGVLMQNLGKGRHMNGLHWNMQDGSIVNWHSHPSEQFGYVIKGGFKIWLDQEVFEIHEGDCYFVPPNVVHKFIALGETEAIDLFNPIKEDLPKQI